FLADVDYTGRGFAAVRERLIALGYYRDAQARESRLATQPNVATTSLLRACSVTAFLRTRRAQRVARSHSLSRRHRDRKPSSKPRHCPTLGPGSSLRPRGALGTTSAIRVACFANA